MTDKERLERVKSLLHWANKYRQEGNGRLIGQTVQQIFEEFHIDWLIQQAECVQELGTKLDKWLDLGLAYEGRCNYLEERNKQYREAIENALEELNNSPRLSLEGLEAMEILGDALEGEE